MGREGREGQRESEERPIERLGHVAAKVEVRRELIWELLEVARSREPNLQAGVLRGFALQLIGDFELAAAGRGLHLSQASRPSTEGNVLASTCSSRADVDLHSSRADVHLHSFASDNSCWRIPLSASM